MRTSSRLRCLKTLRGNNAHYGIEFSGSEKQTLVRLVGSHYIRPLPGFLTRIDDRLATMDRRGIDMQILAGWVDFSAYTMPVDFGVRFAEMQNDCIAEIVAPAIDLRAHVCIENGSSCASN